MACTFNKNLVFRDGMQFMSSSADAWVKNLSDNVFKYLTQKFSSNLLKLVKKESILINIETALKNLVKINYLIDVNFLVL